MLGRTQIQEIFAANKAMLQEDFGIESMQLYGSYALNSQNKDSDIDLLYTLKPGKKMTLRKLGRIEAFLMKNLDINKIELVDNRFINPVVYQNIQSHAILLF